MVSDLMERGTKTGQEACPTLLQVLHHGLWREGGLIAGQPIQPLNDAIMWGRAGPGNDRNL
jgi:hypothetical protein